MSKTYRPPQNVCEESHLGGSPLTLVDVHKLYTGLVTKNEFNSSLRWSRRILRQEDALTSGIAKRLGTTVTLPEAVDLQLGPVIIANFTPSPCDKAADALVEAGIFGTCIPCHDGTLVLLPYDKEVPNDETSFDLPVELDNSQAVIVDSSSIKVRSLAKFNGSIVYSVAETDLAEKLPGIEVHESWLMKTVDRYSPHATVLKVDEGLGLIFGWAIISTINGEEYFDKQNDHIPDDAMLDAAADFMLNSRQGGDMHLTDDEGNKVVGGTIVFAWPLTAEIAKAFDLTTDVTGLMIAYKPSDDVILEKFKDGTYTGFSIGGSRLVDEEVADVVQ